jgi:hypothetical protein
MFDLEENARDDAAAFLRFHGPGYYAVLEWIHEELRPAVYLEIGVLNGNSLELARPPARAIGIDPAPVPHREWRTETVIHAMTSEQFFAANAPAFDFALIDGEHLFEEALADFYRLERLAHPGSLIALHDVIPLDERTAARQRATEFHTGDVWKTLEFLFKERGDLDIVVIAAAPSGLALIRGMNPGRSAPPAALIDRYRGLPFSSYVPPATIPNTREAVRAWLLRTG